MEKTNLEEKIDKVKSGLLYAGLMTPVLGAYRGFMDGMGLDGNMLPLLGSVVIGPTVYGWGLALGLCNCNDLLDMPTDEMGAFAIASGMAIGGVLTAGFYGAGYYVASLMKN